MRQGPSSGYTIQEYGDIYWLRFYGKCTKELTKDLHRYMDGSVMKRRSQYYWITDLGDADIPSGTRAEWSKYLDHHREYVGHFNQGSPYVASSALARGMLTAFHWIFTPPYPVTCTESVDDAVAWLLKRMPNATSMLPASHIVKPLQAAPVQFDNRETSTSRLKFVPNLKAAPTVAP